MFSLSAITLANPKVWHVVRWTLTSLLLAGGILLGVRAVPSLRAHAAYHAVKYGGLAEAPVDERLAVLDKVYRLAPYHYHACLLASDICWQEYLGADENAADEWAARSAMWCERGLASGSATPALFSRKASLMARDDMRAAATFWAAYVDRVYWNPDNQALLCEFYARAGMLEEAAKALALIKGRPQHAAALRVFRQAVYRDMMQP